MPNDEMTGDRTRFRETLCIGVLGLVLFGGTSSIKIERWKKYHRAEFGTVKNPAYLVMDTVTSPREFTEVEALFNPTCEQLIEKRTLIEKIEDSFKKKECDTTLLQQADSVFVYRTLESHQFRHQSEESENIARDAFERATGRKFPSSIRFVREAQAAGVLGQHKPIRGTISYPGKNTYAEIPLLMHEFGHGIAQYAEENPLLVDNSEVNAIEEAAAYAFVDPCLASARISLSHQLHLKAMFEYQIYTIAGTYFSNDRTAHSEGVVYFLAARQILRDSALTYNVLATIPGSTLKNVPREIQEHIPIVESAWAAQQELLMRYMWVKKLAEKLAHTK